MTSLYRIQVQLEGFGDNDFFQIVHTNKREIAGLQDKLRNNPRVTSVTKIKELEPPIEVTGLKANLSEYGIDGV